MSLVQVSDLYCLSVFVTHTVQAMLRPWSDAFTAEFAGHDTVRWFQLSLIESAVSAPAVQAETALPHSSNGTAHAGCSWPARQWPALLDCAILPSSVHSSFGVAYAVCALIQAAELVRTCCHWPKMFPGASSDSTRQIKSLISCLLILSLLGATQPSSAALLPHVAGDAHLAFVQLDHPVSFET